MKVHSTYSGISVLPLRCPVQSERVRVGKVWRNKWTPVGNCSFFDTKDSFEPYKRLLSMCTDSPERFQELAVALKDENAVNSPGTGRSN